MDTKYWRSLKALTLLYTLAHITAVDGANILAIFTFVGSSHNAMYTTVTKELARRGHHLTVVTSRTIESPPANYHQIDVQDVVAHNFKFTDSAKKAGLLDMVMELRASREKVCRGLKQKQEVKALTKPRAGNRFDLILLSNFFNECLYPFARIHNAPIVLISPAGPMPSTYSAVGNVVLPSYYVDPFIGQSDRMNLKERVLNTLVTMAISIFYKYDIQSAMESDMRWAFGEDTPSISELEEYVSLGIINHHFSLNQARQTVPGLIEAGGLHIKPPKELPKDLKTFLDGAKEDGVIYFSLGTILKSSGLPKQTRDELIAAFSEVKQRVLWKWDGDALLPGQPKNVRLEKWLPQQDVLAHPNIKVFITQGGLLSFQEAASRGVPIIGIPFFGDQAINMKSVLQHGVGVQLDAQNLTAHNVLNAINEVLENPKYSTNMKRLQSIVNDQKEHPLERTIYWIEYVVRHNGAKHLKPAAYYLHWSQIYMLDVFFILVVIPCLLTLTAVYVCSTFINKMCSCSTTSVTSNKKNQ
ncbi:UDP-glucosyltransferase 2-like [Ischnura elegans]|uniref:UDP-glucosyltransferase 2-like n=1 Tax=Ischnura elegans TaxID=197161 RepID=UPI001ED8A326|nr:UDP-glucosyltransferase 2-like [Ischnura elegans]